MKTTPKSLFSEIRAYCLAHADDKVVKKYSRYFKDGYDAYGLTQEQTDIKKTELLQRRDINLTLIFHAAPILFQSGKYEETSFVLVLLRDLHEQYTRETFNRIEALFSIGIRNWAHADILGMQILPSFILKGQVSSEDFKPWIQSEYLFQRRCVPVTFIKLLKTEKSYASLFDLIEPLMTDPAREVHQGTGWFLREAWKIRNQETEDFLLKWKDTSPRLIFQYACEKMSAEDKQRFRRNQR